MSQEPEQCSYAAPLPPRIHLTCSKCGRNGSYSRERYVELTGTSNGVVALQLFAKNVAKCPAAQIESPTFEERCGILHDLIKEGRPYISSAEPPRED